MSYTTPRTWSAGERPTAAQFNQDIRDNVAFLANPPAVRVTNSGTQSLTSASEATLSWDTETFDTDTMHASGSPTRITFTTAGLYQVSWSITVASDNDYLWLYSYLRLNGATLIAVGSSVGTQTDNGLSPHSTGSALYKFAAADYVEIRAAQKNTSAGADAVSTNAYFSAVWVGKG